MSPSPPYETLMYLLLHGWLTLGMQVVILAIVIWASYQAWRARQTQQELRELDEQLNGQIIQLSEGVVTVSRELARRAASDVEIATLRRELARHTTSDLLHSERSDVR